MVETVGLLSRGHEEMIKIAWKTFSSFQTSREAMELRGRQRRMRRPRNTWRDSRKPFVGSKQKYTSSAFLVVST
jgi:uncharacterized protein (DUF2235 family)